MGKTMVVTCCVLAEPASDLKPIKDSEFHKWLEAVRSTPTESAVADESDDDGGNESFKHETEPTLSMGLTLIVVNNTLVQQWADELQKFAPSLVVHKFYGSSSNKEAALQGLRSADVLLTTPHMLGYVSGLPKRMLRHMRVHRLVVDESHLMAARGGKQMRSRLLLIRAARTWLVSGTPFSTSLDQLEAQSALLGCQIHGAPDIRRLGLGHGFITHDRPEYMSNDTIVDWLRTRLIRHTKRMRIGGDVALALPDADCKTVWLEMSEDERLLYGIHECASGHTMKLDQGPSSHNVKSRGNSTDPDHNQRGMRYAAAAHVYDEHVVAGNEGAMHPYDGWRYSLKKPSQSGRFEEAAEAYSRMYAPLLTSLGATWHAPLTHTVWCHVARPPLLTSLGATWHAPLTHTVWCHVAGTTRSRCR